MSNFPTDYQEFIYTRTYSRWLDDIKRREVWPETIKRYEEFFNERVPSEKKAEFKESIQSILNLEVMPSMRALWTAGPALSRENIAGYNCSYLAVNTIKSFSECLYILLCGTGCGYSVERQEINKLPVVPELKNSENIIEFADSKRGWAEGFYRFMKKMYEGEIPVYDLSKIRPKGSILKVFGGRASGPEPLEDLIKFTVNIFKNAQGRKLSSIECHDIMCKIAASVVVGGVRRSACISLSNRSDDRMAHAKDGEFWNTNPQRMLANNSIVYTEKPDATQFMEDWLNLSRSGSGERGIFNRESADFIVSQTGRRKAGYDFGCNPCSEIILRPNEFCNLSEVVVRPKDTKQDLRNKVRQATIIGCLQATLSDFNFISRSWKNNTEEERLLGVSLTGLRDHPIIGKTSKKAKAWLTEMRETAIETAETWSKALGINMPCAITCTKPSGTVSQLVDSASGLHPRYSPYYIRRVRVSTSDPMFKYLDSIGLEWDPEVGQERGSCTTAVFPFPVKSPETSVMRDDVDAMEQLEYWLMIQKYWCEHKPSITVYVKDFEWMKVGSWVYDHWNYVSGISFLPYDGGVYPLAPYTECSEDEYNELMQKMPEIDFTMLSEFEKEDRTEGSREFNCTGDKCEL